MRLAQNMDVEGESELQQSTRLLALLGDHLEDLNVKHDSGTVFECVEDLEYHSLGMKLMGKIMPSLVTGVPTGNVLRLTSSEAQPTQ